jgi:hydroxymethylglutaryl-CoA reductase
MVIEEPSVVAAASNASRMLRAGGGITATSTDSVMIGQIQLVNVPDHEAAEQQILAAKDELLAFLDEQFPGWKRRGGGPRDLQVRQLPPMEQDDPLGHMVIVHILVDVCDAMGANAINSMCEALAPRLATLSGGTVRLRILSNLSDERLVTVKGRVPAAAFCKKDQPLEVGIETAKGIE